MPDCQLSKVVYLIGAGATHGSIKAVGASTGLLIRDLEPYIAEEVRKVLNSRKKYEPFKEVVNEIILNGADIEHVITFFDESSSAVYRDLADDLRRIFERVLKRELAKTKKDLREDRLALYSALLDMYNVEGIDERLQGLLTLNYDDYIEAAARAVYNGNVDYGVEAGSRRNGELPVLKLHGSFAWHDVWPVRVRSSTVARPLWIPPGIRKGKDRYPFNLVWGRAREVLDCDVLRVVGCKLGPSDWDLISLLFSTRHSNINRERAYTVEVIDSPNVAMRLQREYPYLDVRSVLEISTYDVGENLVAELGGPPMPFADLNPQQAAEVLKAAADPDEDDQPRNWFQMWLVQMGEGIQRQLGEEATGPSDRPFRKWLGI